MTQDPLNLAKYIDHTLLRADAPLAAFKTLCAEAAQYGFASVCIPPSRVEFCYKTLVPVTPVKVCTVIGFPFGYTDTDTKIFEAKNCLKLGADELDMVLNISAFKSGEHDLVRRELELFRQATSDKLIKLILETCYLTPEEIHQACLYAVEAGWNFVKTSTGYGSRGASPEDIELMRKAVSGKALIKASGGIRDLNTAQSYLNAGASRLGTSSGVVIVSGSSTSQTRESY